MRKALYYLLIGTISSFFLSPTSTASHYYGGSIETLCLSGCTLQVKVTLQADCHSSVNAPQMYSFYWDSVAGCTPPTQITAWQAAPVIEISPICPNAVASCAPTANVPATWQSSFTAQFEYCSASACVFTPIFTQCCRDEKIVSIANPGGSVFAIKGTRLDLASLGCNSSPVFHYPTPLYITTTQSNQMYVGGLDPNGDSLVYALGSMLTNAGTATNPYISPFPYSSGYSATAPFGPNWQVSLNPNTGLLTATPTPGSIDMCMVDIYTYEYRNGVQIGYSIREIALYSSPLMGSNLGPVIAAPTNLNGMQAIGVDSFVVCSSGMVGFDIPITDPNNDTVRVSWDGYIGSGTFFDANNPSATNNFAGVSPTARFQFTPPGPGTYRFRVLAQDDYCPLGLQADALYTIIVGTGLASPPSVSVSGTIGACFSTPATISATAGYASYLWSNGQTTSSISTNIPGIYTVTITSGGGCQFTNTATVLMAPGSFIQGNITTHLGAPLANQKVLLVSYLAIPGTLTSMDTVLTDNNGDYLFCNILAPIVLVKALPDSAAYPMDLPTYADTALFWNDAVQFLGPITQATVNFSTRGGTNPGGPGFMGGFVALGANKTAGVGDPIANLFLAIQDSATGTVYSVVQTDANGYFRVGTLPYGTYRILTDWPGINHTDSVPLVRISANQPHRDSLDFRLHSTYLEWVEPVVVSIQIPRFPSLQLFPNPASGTVSVQLPEQWQSIKVSATLFDLSGKAMQKYSFSGTETELDIRTFTPGVYWLKVEAGGYTETLKLLIQR